MTELNNEQNVSEIGVKGWLLLFCLSLTIFSPIRTFYYLFTSYDELASLFYLFPGVKNLLYIDGTLSIILMIISIRAGIALWSIKPGAVKTAKNYLLFFLGYTVIALFLPFTAGLPAEANEVMIPEMAKGGIKALIYFGIWFWYLNVSTRVAATYNISPQNDELENTAYVSEPLNKTEEE